MSESLRDLEGFLAEISEAVGTTRYYDDIQLSVEGIERVVAVTDPAEQGQQPFKRAWLAIRRATIMF